MGKLKPRLRHIIRAQRGGWPEDGLPEFTPYLLLAFYLDPDDLDTIRPHLSPAEGDPSAGEVGRYQGVAAGGPPAANRLSSPWGDPARGPRRRSVVRRVLLVGFCLVAAVSAAVRNYAAVDRPWSPAAARAAERSGELWAEIRAAEARIRLQDEAAAGLVRGGVTVDEAEAAFRDALASDPAVWARRADQAGLTDRGFVLRTLAAFVRRFERLNPDGADPDRVAAVLGRLEAAITLESGSGLRAAGPEAV